VPKNLEELNSLLEWPKRISSSEDVVDLRAGAGILDFVSRAIGDVGFEFGKRDLYCGDETQDGDAGR